MNTSHAINRREAVRRIALLMGSALVGSPFILSGQRVPDKTPTTPFTNEDKALLDEIGETIVPTTAIPGAKAVHIGDFMAMMVNDCYSDSQHAVFKQGLVKINDDARAKYSKSFMECTDTDRTTLCNDLDVEQKAYNLKKADQDAPHYFRMMKELAVIGYFSSEIGATQAVKYIEVPGSFNGNLPYKKGDRAWY